MIVFDWAFNGFVSYPCKSYNICGKTCSTSKASSLYFLDCVLREDGVSSEGKTQNGAPLLSIEKVKI